MPLSSLRPAFLSPPPLHPLPPLPRPPPAPPSPSLFSTSTSALLSSLLFLFISPFPTTTATSTALLFSLPNLHLRPLPLFSDLPHPLLHPSLPHHGCHQHCPLLLSPQTPSPPSLLPPQISLLLSSNLSLPTTIATITALPSFFPNIHLCPPQISLLLPPFSPFPHHDCHHHRIPLLPSQISFILSLNHDLHLYRPPIISPQSPTPPSSDLPPPLFHHLLSPPSCHQHCLPSLSLTYTSALFSILSLPHHAATYTTYFFSLSPLPPSPFSTSSSVSSPPGPSSRCPPLLRPHFHLRNQHLVFGDW